MLSPEWVWIRRPLRYRCTNAIRTETGSRSCQRPDTSERTAYALTPITSPSTSPVCAGALLQEKKTPTETTKSMMIKIKRHLFLRIYYILLLTRALVNTVFRQRIAVHLLRCQHPKEFLILRGTPTAAFATFYVVGHHKVQCGIAARYKTLSLPEPLVR